MTYQEAVEYLDSFINYEKVTTFPYTSLKLDRVTHLLDSLGNPHRKFKAIQVAGTKGKGSTCAFVASILREAGFKTGLYTSPHLSTLRERIRILSSRCQPPTPSLNKENEFEGMISEQKICQLVDRIRPCVERFRNHPELGTVTFFEVYTALAFLYFSNLKEGGNVEFAVLETGLGGRLDATNLVEPCVWGITPISLEHTQVLGNTIRKIAKEKAGIIKGPNSVGVCSPQEKEVLDIIRDRCRENRVRSFEVGREILFEEVGFNQGRQVFNLRGIFEEYPYLSLKLLGEHQLINAATAVGIIEALRFYGIYIPQEAVRRGLENVFWPGRLELVGKNPMVLLDGAQNVASCIALKKAIKKFFHFQRLILILGISKDKDIKGICEELTSIASEIILTKASNPRAAEPETIKQEISAKVNLTQGIKEAIDMARSKAKKEDLILITGSLFVVGEARRLCIT